MCATAQVLELLQLTCYLQGRVCSMMYVVRIDSKHSPADWLDLITAGAQQLQPPLAVNMVKSDDWIRFYPASKQFVHMVRVRT